MKTLYIGDTHANFEIMDHMATFVLAMYPDIVRVVQVGDFGFWPQIDWEIFSNRYQKSTLPIPVWFIDGNHEDHATLNALASNVPTRKSPLYDAYHVPRGYVQDNVLYMGGASSIDRRSRTNRVNWFEEEAITESDYYKAQANFIGQKINVMVCHDTSIEGFQYVCPHMDKAEVGQMDRRIIEFLLWETKPKVLVHGHHHVSRQYRINHVTFIALKNVDSYVHVWKDASEQERKWIASLCCAVVDNDGNIYDIVNFFGRPAA